MVKCYQIREHSNLVQAAEAVKAAAAIYEEMETPSIGAEEMETPFPGAEVLNVGRLQEMVDSSLAYKEKLEKLEAAAELQAEAEKPVEVRFIEAYGDFKDDRYVVQDGDTIDFKSV